MAVISLSCPNCGGPVHKEDKNCKYCNASINFSPDYKQVKLIGFPCPKCGNPTEKGDRFCSKCASSLVVKCPSCRHDVAIGSIFCPNCRTNFAVAKLIEEAKQKKLVVTESYAEKERNLLSKRDEFTKVVRERVNREAYSLTTKANQMGNNKVAAFCGYLVIVIVPIFFTGLLSIIEAFSGKEFFVFITLIVIVYLITKKFYPPFVEVRVRKELLVKAHAMKEDDYWKNYITKTEVASLKQKDEEMERTMAALKTEMDQEFQTIDEWIESTVSLIH